MGHRDAWDEDDRRWVLDYVASDDYEALADYYEGRGLGWPRDPQQVLKALCEARVSRSQSSR
ncbi:hypothetical protein GO496_04725 [Acidovorax citrulli]|nr:hypothetical protein [Paracidovorax citrulli]